MRAKLIVVILLSVGFSLTVMAQNDVKRIAILETVDRAGDVNLGVKNLLRQSITFGINRIQGYEGYNRVDMAQITGELTFQQTGYVSDAQIKKVGEMTGAAYVLIAEATNYDATHIVVYANLVDVETGRITNSSIPKVASVDPEKMYDDCAEVAKSLLNVSSGGTGSGRTQISTNYSSKQDFTETAWDINMKMVWVEGGDFMMGCTSEQSGCESDENNVRRVTVDGFYIGMLEVTQTQWEKVMGTSIYQQKTKAGASNTYGVGADYPMYYVSWEEAMEFCRLLSNKTGKTYTLPTEAQWEYAARGGKKQEGTKYSGSNMVDAVAWYTDNSGSTTHPCGTKRANALGIYDMSGNVWEWCRDWYSSSYASYDTNNPTGPSSGSNRVARGGSWYDDASYCRVANRYDITPGDRGSALGFRVVLLP